MNDARNFVPDQASFAERYPTNPTASALEIINHCRWFASHPLAQAPGHDRHVDECEKLVSIDRSPTRRARSVSPFPGTAWRNELPHPAGIRRVEAPTP